MHRSSTQVAIWGKSWLTGWPHSPYRRNSQGDFNRFPVLAKVISGLGNGKGLPFISVSLGLGSKVSMCETPPCRKRKMTRLALGRKWVGLGTRGLRPPEGVRAARASSEDNPAKAR